MTIPPEEVERLPAAPPPDLSPIPTEPLPAKPAEPPVIYSIRGTKTGFEAKDNKGNQLVVVYDQSEAPNAQGKKNGIDDKESSLICDGSTPTINPVRLLFFAPEIKKQVSELGAKIGLAVGIVAAASDLNPVGKNGTDIKGKVKDTLRSIAIDGIDDVETTSFTLKPGAISPIAKICADGRKHRILD
jgi:hypothetical protein